MGRINWSRVLLGGLVAGVVINISEIILNGFVLAADFEQAMANLGLTGEPEGPALAVWIVYGFIVGIAAVWLYAAIRPRFGPGPGTAVRAALVVWLLAYLLSSTAMVNMGLFAARLVAIGAAWGLVEVIIATLLGAWLYREERPAS